VQQRSGFYFSIRPLPGTARQKKTASQKNFTQRLNFQNMRAQDAKREGRMWESDWGGVTLRAISIVFSETSNDPANSVDKQKRDKKNYTSKYNQGDPSPRRFNFREALGDEPHKSNPSHASNRPEQHG